MPTLTLQLQTRVWSARLTILARLTIFNLTRSVPNYTFQQLRLNLKMASETRVVIVTGELFEPNLVAARPRPHS